MLVSPPRDRPRASPSTARSSTHPVAQPPFSGPEQNAGGPGRCWSRCVSTSKQETARQHDALDGLCVKVLEQKISGSLTVDARPTLAAAIDYLRPGDMLTVQEVDRLGRNLLEGLLVLNDLFSRGIAGKVLDGIATGEHTERSLILDLALALAKDRRRDIVRKTRDGLDAARARGRTGGRAPRRRHRQATHHPRPPCRRRIHPHHRPRHQGCPSAPSTTSSPISAAAATDHRRSGISARSSAKVRSAANCSRCELAMVCDASCTVSVEVLATSRWRLVAR